jgi:heparan-alpha-glucosaminide N-acetyltransferase
MGVDSATAVPFAPTGVARLLSLDAFRGFTMLAMVSGGLGMKNLISDPTWGWLAEQMDHRAWEGCTAWDLIQPAFLFMVGVAMPFSFARRQEQGESWGSQFGHVLQRCLLLAAIGIFLDCYAERRIYVQFIRVLQQIALAYPIAFLVLKRGIVPQALAALLILIVHPLAFVLYERWTASGAGAWTIHANFGSYLDALLHLPPSSGGYATFNAFSSAATILFGVMAGELLRTALSPWSKVLVLVAAGLAGLAIGWELTNWVPMIKRLWTSSFAIFAGGWTCLMMASFYLLIDILQFRRWAFPFVVAGMNSIAIYVFAGICGENVRRGLSPFLEAFLDKASPGWPVALAIAVVGVTWLFCYWLYRHRIFFKV